MWHYSICKKYTIVAGEKSVFYCIVEYYPNVPGAFGETLWSKTPEWPCGESRKEVITCLENMLEDAKRYKTVIDREPYE